MDSDQHLSDFSPLVGWRPSLVGWRPSLLGSSCYWVGGQGHCYLVAQRWGEVHLQSQESNHRNQDSRALKRQSGLSKGWVLVWGHGFEFLRVKRMYDQFHVLTGLGYIGPAAKTPLEALHGLAVPKQSCLNKSSMIQDLFCCESNEKHPQV